MSLSSYKTISRGREQSEPGPRPLWAQGAWLNTRYLKVTTTARVPYYAADIQEWRELLLLSLLAVVLLEARSASRAWISGVDEDT